MSDVVEVTRTLEARAQDVFDAWTDADQLQRWLCPHPGVVTEATCDPVVGGTYRLVMVFDDGAVEVTGEYLQVEPPHKLVFTWVSDGTASTPTRVSVALRPDGATTEMTITHERIPGPAFSKSARSSWNTSLDKLEQLLAVRQ